VTRSLADPHCHTLASDGMVTPEDLVEAALAAGLDLIAVCDHDTMAGVQETADRGAERGLEVVKAIEVTTRWPAQTHILGWFVEKPVRGGMTLRDTVRAIHDQDGLAVIPHPFMPIYFASCQPRMLEQLIEVEHVDAIETEFTPPISKSRRQALEAFYEAHSERLGARVGASDSHFGAYDIGRVVTAYEGRTAGDFKAAVVNGRTEPLRRERRPVPARLLAKQQVRGLFALPLRRLRGQLQ
jgi:predicted metal-dependent phosphoesterase TrpH